MANKHRSTNLKSGDPVSWSTSQGSTRGVITKKITKTTKLKGYVAKATVDDPQFKVRSAKTGQEAIHKPGALSKRS